MAAPAETTARLREATRVEAKLRARLAPDAETLRRVAAAGEGLVRAANEAARLRHSPLVRALVAGSAARGTFLKDRLDIDLFLLFPPELSREELSAAGMPIAEAILTDPERKYAEHPYLRGRFEGFAVDAVPGYAVSDPAHPLSPVDRTPFHDAYLKERQTPAMADEVRLAKQFLRGLGIYGSEARTEGLSGYLVELLVLQFGTLRGLLESARSWRIPARLCEPREEPPRLPVDVALIRPDPVDPHRNVASALSRRNLALLILGADEYLRAPAESWFETAQARRLGREEALRRLSERGTHASVISLPRPSLVDDTLYPQLRKAERAIAEEASRAGFEVLGSASEADPATVLVILEVGHPRLSSVRTQDGPPAGLDRVGAFLAKWLSPEAPSLQGPYVRHDGKLGIEVRREDRELEAVLRRAIPRLSLGRQLSAAEGSEVRPLSEQPPSAALEIALAELLDKRLPWTRSSPTG